MTNHEIFASINVLIKTCNEVEHVFRCAAENVLSSELSVIIAGLGDNSQQRARELENHLVLLGGHTAAGRHLGFAVHRAWLSVRSLFCFNVDLEMLKVCKSREDQAITQYRRALEKPLPASLHILLNRHYLGARCNSARITDLIALEQTIAPKCYRRTTLNAVRSFRTGQRARRLNASRWPMAITGIDRPGRVAG
jgi:uncharacterized protein (TIGR02284 family)